MKDQKNDLFEEPKKSAEQMIKDDVKKQVQEELENKKKESGETTFRANKIFEDELTKERLRQGLLVRRYVDREILLNDTLYQGNEIVTPEVASTLDEIMSRSRSERFSHGVQKQHKGSYEMSSAGQITSSNPASRIGG